MSKSHIGGKRPRYSFFLNPYSDVRFTRCPRCQRLTNLRKFALLIHTDAMGLIALGMTSRFCPKCDLIIVHQDELEPQLATILTLPLSGKLSTQYLVIGTLPLSVWKSAMRNRLGIEVAKHLASDFKEQLIFTPSSESP